MIDRKNTGYKCLAGPLACIAASVYLLLTGPVRTGFAEDTKILTPNTPFIENILESPQREQWQQPDRVIRSLGLKKGDAVADVGAGSGYFSFRLADLVGSNGKVYAADIDDEMLNFMRGKMENSSITNITLVKSSMSDSNLPVACCNNILMVNTFHELAEPLQFMRNLRKSLKKDGSVAIINWNKNSKAGPLYVPEPEILNLMKQAGFGFVGSENFLKKQFFLKFKPRT